MDTKVNSPFNQHVYIDYANTISKGYCFYNKYLYEYNPIFDIWERMACLVLSYGNYVLPVCLQSDIKFMY